MSGRQSTRPIADKQLSANSRRRNSRSELRQLPPSVATPIDPESSQTFKRWLSSDFINNLGPDAQTYPLAGEVVSTAFRGKGAGFAKVGASSPRAARGTSALLYGLVDASILGAIVTWLFRIKTTGVNLVALDEADPEAATQSQTA